MIFYHIAIFFMKIGFNLFFNIKVEGRENIPPGGRYILIANHVFLPDPIILAITSPHILRFMGKAEIFSNPFMRLLLKGLGVFSVHRGTGDGDSLKTAVDILEDGGVLGIFPEGTRSYGGEPGTPKAGAAYLAAQVGADVLPACITYERGTKFRSKVTVRYGELVPKEIIAAQPEGKTGRRNITDLTFGAVLNLLQEGKE